jgi:hypothetical protein
VTRERLRPVQVVDPVPSLGVSRVV